MAVDPAPIIRFRLAGTERWTDAPAWPVTATRPDPTPPEGHFFTGQRSLHLRLARYHAHREWYRDCPEVRETLIAAAREHGGIWLL